jgi:hypothetical protein
MRLTFDCATPTIVPISIVMPAIADSTGAHGTCNGSKVERNTRRNAANAAALTPVDMKPVTSVGAPS